MPDPRAFWWELASDLTDPDLRREYIAESELIAAVDAKFSAEVTMAYDALVADPTRGLSAAELRMRLAQRRPSP